MFIGKGSSAVGRLFKTAGAELYRYQAGYGGLYRLGCRRSLALVKEEGKASGAYAGGACADGACVDGACADEAYIGRACADRACVDKAACQGTDNIKGVNKHDLRRQFIAYKLKGPLLLINSLISLSNYSVRSSS